VLDDDPDVYWWRQGRSLPYGESRSVWALGEIVKAQAGILESDDGPTAAGKLSAMVEELLPDEKERSWVASHLRTLAGVIGEIDESGDRRVEAFSAWRRFFEALAEERPLILIFEDLHWADDTRARLRRLPRRMGVGHADARHRNGAAGAARAASRLGRRQAERDDALDRCALGDGHGETARVPARPDVAARRRADGRYCAVPRAIRSTPASTSACSRTAASSSTTTAAGG